MPRDEAVTLVPCPACAGRFKSLIQGAGGRYRTVYCGWCTSGACTAEQIKAWHARPKPE